MPVHGRRLTVLASLLCALALPAGAAADDDDGTVFDDPPAATESLDAETCSSGPRTLSQPGDRVYPDQGNGGYESVHTDLHIAYDTLTNLFLAGTHADLTIQSTQCL